MNRVSSNLDMTFQHFVELYKADKQGRIKENTWKTNNHITQTKLLPYFGKLKMDSITAQQIITWQNEMLNYKGIHRLRDILFLLYRECITITD